VRYDVLSRYVGAPHCARKAWKPGGNHHHKVVTLESGGKYHPTAAVVSPRVEFSSTRGVLIPVASRCFSLYIGVEM